MSCDKNILRNCDSGCNDDCCTSIEIKRINSILKYIMDNALFTGGNNSDLENDSNFISCDVLEGCLKRQDIRSLISLIVSGDIAWGNIKGNILNQTDLTNILNGKFDNPNGTSNDYLDGTGAPTPFPNFLECDDLEHCPEIIGIKNSIPKDISDLTDNSGSLFDGDYDSLSNKPTFKTVDGQSVLGVGDIAVGDNNVQSDWNELNPSSDAFIKNKPTLPVVNDGQLELNTSGIATGGTQSFSANQAGNTIFTVDVPGTDITLSFNNNILTVSSSTGQSDNIDLSSLVTADTYVVSMSLSGNTLILTKNDSTTVQQDLSSILFDGDYNSLTNTPTFKTVDGQSILGVGDISDPTFRISLTFEAVETDISTAAYNMKIVGVDLKTVGLSETITVNGSSYTYGSTINKGDRIEIDTDIVGFVIFNCEYI